MRQFLFALAVAAVATTGLMADKCSYAPSFYPNQQHDEDGKKQDK